MWSWSRLVILGAWLGLLPVLGQAEVVPMQCSLDTTSRLFQCQPLAVEPEPEPQEPQPQPPLPNEPTYQTVYSLAQTKTTSPWVPNRVSLSWESEGMRLTQTEPWGVAMLKLQGIEKGVKYRVKVTLGSTPTEGNDFQLGNSLTGFTAYAPSSRQWGQYVEFTSTDTQLWMVLRVNTSTVGQSLLVKNVVIEKVIPPTDDLTLQWLQDPVKEDGSCLLEPVRFEFRYGEQSGQHVNSRQVDGVTYTPIEPQTACGPTRQYQYTLTDMPLTPLYIVARTQDKTGQWSQFSQELSVPYPR